MAKNFLTDTLDTEKWTTEAEEVFSDKEYSHTTTTAPSLNSVFKELLIRYKLNIKSWWEVKSFESYIKNKIVPKGLRIPIQPAPRSRTPALMKRWEQEATNSSLRFMLILLEEEKITCENSAKKLKETTDIALKLKGEPDFNKKEAELQTTIEKFTATLKERKHFQFVRDFSEFKENRAYTFLNTNTRRGGADSDISSSDTDTEGGRRRTPYTRQSPINTRYRTRGGWNGNRGKNNQKYRSNTDLRQEQPSSSYSSSVQQATVDPSFLERAPQTPGTQG